MHTHTHTYTRTRDAYTQDGVSFSVTFEECGPLSTKWAYNDTDHRLHLLLDSVSVQAASYTHDIGQNKNHTHCHTHSSHPTLTHTNTHTHTHTHARAHAYTQDGVSFSVTFEECGPLSTKWAYNDTDHRLHLLLDSVPVPSSSYPHDIIGQTNHSTNSLTPAAPPNAYAHTHRHTRTHTRTHAHTQDGVSFSVTFEECGPLSTKWAYNDTDHRLHLLLDSVSVPSSPYPHDIIGQTNNTSTNSSNSTPTIAVVVEELCLGAQEGSAVIANCRISDAVGGGCLLYTSPSPRD